MKALLMRHALASWDAPSDRERPLTAVGEDQARRAADSIAAHAAIPKRIVHSPWLRTSQRDPAKTTAAPRKMAMFSALLEYMASMKDSITMAIVAPISMAM